MSKIANFTANINDFRACSKTTTIYYKSWWFLTRKILWTYWAITVTIAMIIGIFTGIVFNFYPRLSLLAGYAGTDILEGIYKSFKTEKVLVVTAKK